MPRVTAHSDGTVVSGMSRLEKRLSLLFYLLIAYILLQFFWWAYLLIDLNSKYYADEGAERVRLKVLMVAGEGAVFLVFLLAGVYIMQRTIRKDMSLVRQQRNFLLSITHELKTPVAAIKLCLQTLEKRSGLTQEQRLPLQQTAIENTERLHKLIDNVLMATRIESGQAIIQKQAVNLSKLTTELARGLLQPLAGEEALLVQVEPAVMAPVDEGMFESILVNLVENAVKYGQGGPIEISLRAEQAQVVLKVADQGPGIPEEERKRVFEKFYRMGNEETRTRKGTGLGLYIVARLVELHGAKLTLADNHPSGTVFSIRFPK